MEKSLLEKVLNGTDDDIDKMMVAARVAKAMKELSVECSKFSSKMKELQTEYEDELKLAGGSVVFSVSDGVVLNGKPICKVVFGAERIIDKMIATMKEDE